MPSPSISCDANAPPATFDYTDDESQPQIETRSLMHAEARVQRV